LIFIFDTCKEYSSTRWDCPPPHGPAHEKKGCATDDGQTEESFSRRLCNRHFSRTDSFCTPQIHSQTMSVPSSLRTDHANKITLLAQKLRVGAMMTSVSMHTWKERSFLSS
jgi:hypothetical protein